MGGAGTVAQSLTKRIVELGYSADFADTILTIVFDELTDADSDMLEAGLGELTLALGKPSDKKFGRGYRRDLVGVIWRSMLDRAR